MRLWSSLLGAGKSAKPSPAAAAVAAVDQKPVSSLAMPDTLRDAVTNGDLGKCEALLKSNSALAHCRTPGGWMPLHIASENGHEDVAGLLLGYGADVKAANANGAWPLHLAAKHGKRNILKFFLARGVDVNAKDSAHGQTPLHFATSGGKDVTELLLAHNADVNIKDNYGRTPLQCAAENNKRDVVELLRAGNAGDLSIHEIAALGDVLRLRALIKGNPNVTDRHGKTPLFAAVGNGHKEAVELLLMHGANVEATGAGRSSPLFLAVERGHKEIVELLLANGANPNAADGNDRTPLHAAAKVGRKDLVKLLLAKGGDPNAKDVLGHTPLQQAELFGKADVKELLSSPPIAPEFQLVSDALSQFLEEKDAGARLKHVRALQTMGKRSLAPLLREAFAVDGDPQSEDIDIYKIRLAVWCGCALHPLEFGQYYRTRYREGRSRLLDEMRSINMKDGLGGQTYVHGLLKKN
jgi:ankyrin repeat protein